ncbi:MAG: SDR family NAD(P)-dependent oxidoreductase [Pseudomonadales bacterium]
MNLSGQTAVVTGGGNGIGRALCLSLAAKGANVVVADIELAPAEAVVSEITAFGAKAIATRVDVTDEQDVERLADRAWSAFGSAELLVNNAGVMHATSPLVETTNADYQWIFSVNVGGLLNGIRTFIPRFIEAGTPAHVLNTGSEHSLGVPHVGGGLYTASKHAVLGISDVLRQELPANIGISVLCPGIVGTTLWRAGERRQAEFGDTPPASAEAGAVMQHLGMNAQEVADKAVTGIESGEFLIVTHPHAIDIAKRRWTEIESAFSTQAPRFEGDDKYDLNQLMRKMNKHTKEE